MSLGHGPTIVRDGLVFYYDMENKQKSFKGKPTTNLVTNQNLSEWDVVNTEILPQENGVVVIKPNSNSGNLSRYWKLPVYNVQPGSTYTWSIEVKPVTLQYVGLSMSNYGAWTGGNGGEVRFDIINGTKSSSLGAGPLNYDIEKLEDGWFRIFTTANAGGSVPFSSNINLFLFDSANANDREIPTGNSYQVLVRKPQFEVSDYPTPFVSDARSNTEALLDLTGTNTITPANLTYNSDNTFEFDGVDDYITSSFNVTPGQEITIAGWLYSTETTTSYRNFVDTSTLDPMIWWDTNGKIEFDKGTGLRSSEIYRNQWVYVTLSKPLGTSAPSYYINGELLGVCPRSYSVPARDFTFFNRSGGQLWKGSSSNVKIYNRALTANEVKQNFEATRGRYGI